MQMFLNLHLPGRRDPLPRAVTITFLSWSRETVDV